MHKIYQDITSGVAINMEVVSRLYSEYAELQEAALNWMVAATGVYDPMSRNTLTSVLDGMGYSQWRTQVRKDSYVVEVLRTMAANGIEIASVCMQYHDNKRKADKMAEYLNYSVNGVIYPQITVSETKRVAWSVPGVSNTPADLLEQVFLADNLYEFDMKQADPRSLYAVLGVELLRDKMMSGENFYQAVLEHLGLDLPIDVAKTAWNACVYGGGLPLVGHLGQGAVAAYNFINSIPELIQLREKIDKRIKRNEFYFTTISGDCITTQTPKDRKQLVNYTVQTSSSEMFELFCDKLYGFEGQFIPLVTLYDSFYVSFKPGAAVEAICEELMRPIIVNDIPFTMKCRKVY